MYSNRHPVSRNFLSGNNFESVIGITLFMIKKKMAREKNMMNESLLFNNNVSSYRDILM